MRATHCKACAPSRRAMRIGDLDVEIADWCDCPCANCEALGVEYGTRPLRYGLRSYYKRVVHPVTKRRIGISAPSPEDLAEYLACFEDLCKRLRLSTLTPDDVSRQLLRLTRGAITLERACVEYMKRPTLARNTRRNVASFLATLPAGMSAREVDALDAPFVAAWIEKLAARPNTTHGTVSLAWRLLRAIVRHAIERGNVTSVPWGEGWSPTIPALKRRRARESLRSSEELVRLLEAARDYDHEREARGDLAQYQTKIACASLLGLRQDELCGLVWSDLDVARCRVRIVRQGSAPETKTKFEDVLNAIPALFDLLALHADRLRARKLYRVDGPIFPSNASTPGKPRHDGSTHCIHLPELRRIVARAGLPDPKRWTAHSLKDSFSTLEQETYGGDLPALAKRTRHRSITSLVRYLKTRSREPLAPGFTLPPGTQLTLLAPPRVVPELAVVVTDPKLRADVLEGLAAIDRGELLSAEDSAAYLRELAGEVLPGPRALLTSGSAASRPQTATRAPTEADARDHGGSSVARQAAPVSRCEGSPQEVATLATTVKESAGNKGNGAVERVSTAPRNASHPEDKKTRPRGRRGLGETDEHAASNPSDRGERSRSLPRRPARAHR